MAKIKPRGKLAWDASDDATTTSYVVFQDTKAITYDSPNVDVGKVLTVTLPIAGLPTVEGNIYFGVASSDATGNLSDIVTITPVNIDVTAPLPPKNMRYLNF